MGYENWGDIVTEGAGKGMAVMVKPGETTDVGEIKITK